jgi:Flp pilus assembly pilin Flp
MRRACSIESSVAYDHDRCKEFDEFLSGSVNEDGYGLVKLAAWFLAWVLGLPGHGPRDASLNRVRETGLMNLFSKLWQDDAGVVTIEYLVLGTFLALTLIVGVASLANGINAELTELGGAILTFNQTYNVSGSSGCSASKAGSGATDSCGTLTFTHTAASPCGIDINACAP